jgi:sulfur carrier protein
VPRRWGSEPVQLTVNGRPSDVPDGTTLPDLLASLGLRVGAVVVEHNGTALLRSELPAVVLHDGDRLELVRAVAGG